MIQKIRLWIKNNPVLVGATALALGNLVRDILTGGVDPKTAIETAVLYVVGFMQRSKVIPVAKIPVENPVHPANPDNINK